MKSVNNKLNYYQKIWNLNNCEKIASTLTSDLFLAESNSQKVVLKILTPLGIKDESSGIFYLKSKVGKKCAELFQYDDSAMLIEYLPGQDLLEYSMVNNELKTTEIFCDLILDLNTTIKIEKHPFRHLSSFDNVFNRIKIPTSLGELLSRGREKFQKMAKPSESDILLHGDLHHQNVKLNIVGEFVCYDPKGIIGHPAYEVATILNNPWGHAEIVYDMDLFNQRVEIFSKKLKHSKQTLIDFAFSQACLSIAWCIEDKVDHNHSLQMAKLFERFLV